LGYGAKGTKYGRNWSIHQLPFLTFDGNNVTVKNGSTYSVKFTKPGSDYVAPYFVRDVLTYDSESDVYTLTLFTGEKKTFFGNAEGTPEARRGLLSGMKDRHGHDIEFTYQSESGNLEKVQIGSGSTAVSYHYVWSSERLANVTLQVGGSEVRKVVYSGNDGNLESVTLQQKNDAGEWDNIQQAYYRYESGGTGRMQFAFGDEACRLMAAAGINDPVTASATEVAPYADWKLTYDACGRVDTLKTHGGKYSYSFSYQESPHYPSSNDVWKSKTTVSYPGGSTRTFYYNCPANLLLLKVSGEGKVWYPVCQQFDSKARVILKAASSAVASVSESTSALFTLKTPAGLNTVLEYNGDGNLTNVSLRKGTGGSKVTQRETTYVSRPVDDLTTWLPKTVKVYREATDSGATGEVTTSYDYEWHEPSAQMSKRTTTLPTVPTDENGDGISPVTVVEEFDEWGFLVEREDEMRVTTVFNYDREKGAMSEMVQNSGGLNLRTNYQSDKLGRITQMLGPTHAVAFGGTSESIRRAEWTQYLDAQDEVRSIQGYVKTSNESLATTINPVRIHRAFDTDP
ncbi:MAG: hypothetical protein EBY17_30290, partial [Acidobacteriia bacterium]|nr:hypothetical protein [Terriglobia bacterium]